MLLTILLILLIIALAGGAYGWSSAGLLGFSPFGLVVLVVVILWLSGNL